jgi:integrase
VTRRRIRGGRGRAKAAPASPDLAAQEKKLIAWQMRHGLMMAKPPIMLAEVLDEFIESRKLDRAPRYIVRLMLARRHLLKFFPATTNAHAITPGDVDRYVAERMKKVANATINQETALMKSAFYLGMARQKINHNPLARRRRLPVRKPSEVVRLPVHDDAASLRVIREILARSPGWLEPVILTLLATSERIHAVLALRVSDVQGETIRFRPATLKTKQDGRAVICLEHITKTLAPIMKGLPPDGFIFWARQQPPGAVGLSYHTVWHAWQDAAAKAGYKPSPRLHDIRHFCTSTLDRHGVRETIIQAQLGHATNAMTRHYTHRRIRDTLPAAQVLDGIVGEVAAEERKP